MAKAVTESEVIPDTALEKPSQQFLPASLAWDEADSIDRIEGFDLEKNKAELIGVPFIITRVVFREGSFRRGKEVLPDDYVSVECVTAPPEVYEAKVAGNRRRASEQGIPLSEQSEIGPNEMVVFNDSSTGIRRQIVHYLHTRGLVVVDKDVQPNLLGSYGENPLDLQAASWLVGSDKARSGIDFRLLCPRGLRASRYENEFSPDATTYYLA